LIIVITGCSKGIGLELVKIWAKQHKVYGISRDLSKLKELKSSLLVTDNFDFLARDITQLNSEILNNWIVEDKIDLLINNAGILINKPFKEIRYDDYRKLMDINYWASFNLSQLLLEKLSNAKGQIFNLSSMGGVNYSSKFPGLSLYSSSKAAISILTECLAEELKELNVRVNAFALGSVQTEMLDKAFPGYNAGISAVEMASFIVNFISSSKNLVNGQVIRVAKSNP
jgi:3-oxoacyl-[acyl-carrier protein] reductase